MVFSKIKPIKKVIHSDISGDDFVYYECVCPRCDKEIRAHSVEQCKINYEMHVMQCRKRK